MFYLPQLICFVCSKAFFISQALFDPPLPAETRQHVRQEEEAQSDSHRWRCGAQRQATAGGQADEGGGLAAQPDPAAEGGQEGHEVQQEEAAFHQWDAEGPAGLRRGAVLDAEGPESPR